MLKLKSNPNYLLILFQRYSTVKTGPLDTFLRLSDICFSAGLAVQCQRTGEATQSAVRKVRPHRACECLPLLHASEIYSADWPVTLHIHLTLN